MPKAEYLVPGLSYRHPCECGPRCTQPRSVDKFPPFIPGFNSCTALDTCPPETRNLLDTVNMLAHAAPAKSTNTAYNRTWSLFIEFARTTKQPCTLPVSTYTLALFVAYLYQHNMSAASIRTHLSAVAYLHKMVGYPSPTESFFISKLVKGVSVIAPTGDIRYPVTLPILCSTLSTLPQIARSHYSSVLFFAMMSTAFYVFLRCSEMCQSQHNIHYHQVFISPDLSYAEITFLHFKHSVQNRPFIIRIDAKPIDCPVKILADYMTLRGNQPGYLFCSPDGKAVTRNALTSVLNTALKVLKLPNSHYKLHSFRIGAATAALLNGKSESEI